MTRRRYTRTNKKRGHSHIGGFTGHASPASYNDTQSYMLKTVGNGDTQYNNTFQQHGLNNSGYPDNSNAIRGLQGQHAGRSRRRRVRRRKTKGGFFDRVIKQAIVPLALLGLQQNFKKKHTLKK